MTLAQSEVPRILIADDEGPARQRLRDVLDEIRENFPLAIVDEARTAIAGFEKNADESESGWALVIRATGEKLPVSRRQQAVVKQFR